MGRKIKIRKIAKKPRKTGHFKHFEEIDNYDKSSFYLPRQVSFTINRTLLNWGQSRAQCTANPHKYYVSTTKS